MANFDSMKEADKSLHDHISLVSHKDNNKDIKWCLYDELKDAYNVGYRLVNNMKCELFMKGN